MSILPRKKKSISDHFVKILMIGSAFLSILKALANLLEAWFASLKQQVFIVSVYYFLVLSILIVNVLCLGGILFLFLKWLELSLLISLCIIFAINTLIILFLLWRIKKRLDQIQLTGSARSDSSSRR